MSQTRIPLDAQTLNEITAAQDEAQSTRVYQSCPWTTVVLETIFHGQFFEVAGWSKVSYPDKFRSSTGRKVALNDARIKLRHCLEDYARDEITNPHMEVLPDWEWLENTPSA